jgi:branched-chain amino acid aminotransferase
MAGHGTGKRIATWLDGDWHDGNVAILGAASHAVWLSSIVFDGARAFDGTTPDLGQHCARALASARTIGLGTPVSAEEIEGLARDGLRRFAPGTALYIRPMLWCEEGWIDPDPANTRFCLSLWEVPLPDAGAGRSALVLTTYRRPTPETAPTLAKAACLYPQSGLALRAAKTAGYDDAIVLDMLGNVCEFATSNLFMAKDGTVHTPVPNGCFLAGVTRSRVIALLRGDGVTVVERAIRPEELDRADEVFATGNFGKVLPYTRINHRDLQPGPVAGRARRLYWDYAHS